MKPTAAGTPSNQLGFTLMELMVSMSIFSILLLLTFQVSSTSLSLVKSSENRLATQRDASVAERQLQLDFTQRILRPDAPVRIGKETGNDSLGLLTLRRGYIDQTTTPDRAVSVVSYRIATDNPNDSANGLQRSSSGLGYGLPDRPSFAKGILDLASVPVLGPDKPADAQFQLIARGVIRLELSFIVKDAAQPVRAAPPADKNLIEAVIVTMCVLPSDKRVQFREGDLAKVSSAFGDSTDGKLPASEWIRASLDLPTTLPDLPKNVIQQLKQLRVRQAIIPFHQSHL